MKNLPDNRADLLDLAIDDLERAEKSTDYKVNMDVWHSPDSDGVCHVCLAGSVMAMSLDAAKHSSYVSGHFGKEIGRKLEALNLFRMGRIKIGTEILMGECPVGDEDVKVVDYHENPTKFKQQMRCIAQRMREYDAEFDFRTGEPWPKKEAA